jgi:hypothetical protein
MIDNDENMMSYDVPCIGNNGNDVANTPIIVEARKSIRMRKPNPKYI